MQRFDLGPATEQLSRLVAGVRDEQLGLPTPCVDWPVAELLAHIHQFSTVFTQNARKEPVWPPDDLVAGWRQAIPEQLAEMARAWRQDAAWHGTVSAGGVTMDAANNALVGIEELTVHGWDLAVATGQPFEVGDTTLEEVDRFFTLFPPRDGAGGPFGPPLTPPPQATRLERTIALTGRDPHWGEPQHTS